MMLQLVRRPYRLTKEFERTHIQLTRTWWTPLLEYQQARSFEQFALHIRAVNRSIKTAVIVGFAAAYIHGIPTLNKEKCLVVCLNLPGDRHPPSSRQCTEIMHYRDAALPESDITEVSGKRVTTIERTFVDFCVMYDELESLAFVEAAMRNGNSHEQFQEYLCEHAGQRGVAKAQRILDRAYDIIDSVQETSMRYQMEAQFPTHKISPQVMIRNYRVDHLMEAYSVAGEIGFSWWLVEHYLSYHVNCPDGFVSGEPARGRKDPPYFQMGYGSFYYIPDLVDSFVESPLPA